MVRKIQFATVSTSEKRKRDDVDDTISISKKKQVPAEATFTVQQFQELSADRDRLSTERDALLMDLAAYRDRVHNLQAQIGEKNRVVASEVAKQEKTAKP